MWYQQEIARMIEKIEAEQVLRYLWIIVRDIYKEVIGVE